MAVRLRQVLRLHHVGVGPLMRDSQPPCGDVDLSLRDSLPPHGGVAPPGAFVAALQHCPSLLCVDKRLRQNMIEHRTHAGQSQARLAKPDAPQPANDGPDWKVQVNQVPIVS